MDLLDEEGSLDLSSEKRKIYSNNTPRPPQYIGEGAVLDNAMISEGCVINGKVRRSVLSPGVIVEAGAYISDSVIMEAVVIKSGARVYRSIIDSNTVIEENTVIGSEDFGEITLIGTNRAV